MTSTTSRPTPEPADSKRVENALAVLRTWPRNLEAPAQLRSLYDAATPAERAYIGRMAEALWAGVSTTAHQAQVSRWWGPG